MSTWRGMAVGLALCLNACGFLPSSQPQPFAVTGEIPPNPAPATGFHNADPAINETLAKNICADGYERLDTKTLPAKDDAADRETYTQWQVRCADYSLSLF